MIFAVGLGIAYVKILGCRIEQMKQRTCFVEANVPMREESLPHKVTASRSRVKKRDNWESTSESLGNIFSAALCPVLGFRVSDRR